jgi:hypothetical protein
MVIFQIPKSWRDVKTIFIPKSGRTSYESAKSYRPICLTYFLLKTLERLVDECTRTGLIKLNPLHDSQHAYHREKSCKIALHDLVSSDEITCYTDGSFCDNRSGAGVFSDILILEESYSLGTYTTVF